ncbi:MAG: 50S ribosomal protein L10, partial [Methanoregula sp.]
MAVYTHHLPAWKKDEVAAIKKHAKEYSLIGLVDMYGIPAQQVQQIRRNLRGKAVIKVTRNTLIEHALGEIGGDTKGLTKFISGHSAVIFSNDNPFKLYKQLEKTKTKMAAKAGETAPEDIVIEKGP